LPIEPQLAQAREVLMVQQGKKIVHRTRKKNWPLYLRALDAKKAGASLAKMAKVFWPDDPRKSGPDARDVYEQASALCRRAANGTF
jgi:hypothetical protein